MLQLKTGLNAPQGFIELAYELDRQTYSPELCGDIANMYSRYERCRDSYLLLYDGDVLAGYICFLPIGSSLYAQLHDVTDHEMRDDDITPEELRPWQKEELNHLYVLSVVIRPAYRDGAAVRQLTDGLLAFLRDKETDGYRIGSLSGSVVSGDGAGFMTRLRAKYVKDIDGGYRYYATDRKSTEELLKDGFILHQDL